MDPKDAALTKRYYSSSDDDNDKKSEQEASDASSATLRVFSSGGYTVLRDLMIVTLTNLTEDGKVGAATVDAIVSYTDTHPKEMLYQRQDLVDTIVTITKELLFDEQGKKQFQDWTKLMKVMCGCDSAKVHQPTMLLAADCKGQPINAALAKRIRTSLVQGGILQRYPRTYWNISTKYNFTKDAEGIFVSILDELDSDSSSDEDVGGDDYYQQVHGAKMDRKMLRAANDVSQNRQQPIDCDGVEQLLVHAADAQMFTQTEQLTWDYIHRTYKFTEAGEQAWSDATRDLGKLPADKNDRKTLQTTCAGLDKTSLPADHRCKGISAGTGTRCGRPAGKEHGIVCAHHVDQAAGLKSVADKLKHLVLL